MSKFTPTPGHWRTQQDDKAIIIVTGDGARIGEIYDDDDDAEFSESNARLVCAASELLKRLEAIVRAHPDDTVVLHRELDRARKLISEIRAG